MRVDYGYFLKGRNPSDSQGLSGHSSESKKQVLLLTIGQSKVLPHSLPARQSEVLLLPRFLNLRILSRAERLARLLHLEVLFRGLDSSVIQEG